MQRLPPIMAVASLGIFPLTAIILRRWRRADSRRRILGTDPDMDGDMQARFMFARKEVTLPDGELLGESDYRRSRSGFSCTDRGPREVRCIMGEWRGLERWC